MADENVSFNFDDGGTAAALGAALDSLGISGQQALDAVQSSMRNLYGSAKDTEIAAKTMAAAFSAGISGTDLEQLLALLRQVTAQTQAASTNATNLSTALQGVGTAAGNANTTTAAHNTTVGSLTTNYGGAATAATQLGTAVTQQTQQVTAANSAFRTLVDTVLAYVSATKLIHDVDVVSSVTAQITALVGEGDKATEIFDKLAQSALSTQQSLEDAGKGFSQIYGAIRQGNGTAEQALTIYDNLAKIFFATRTNASLASRAMREFAETMAQGHVDGQRLAALEREIPAALSKIGEGLGINIQAMVRQSDASEKLRFKLKDLQDQYDNGTTPSVAHATAEINKANAEHDRHQAALTKSLAATNLYADGTRKSAEANAAWEKQVNLNAAASTKYSAALAKGNKDMSAAKQAADEKLQQEIKLTKSALDAADAQDKLDFKTGLASQTFIDYANGLYGAAASMGTVSGAFTNLNTQFELWLKDSGAANDITKAFNITLGLLGANLDTIIPVLVAFGVALAAWKLFTITASIVEFVANLNPLTIGLTLLAAAVIIITGKMGLWDDAINAVYASIGKSLNRVKDHKKATDDSTVSVLSSTKAIDDQRQKLIDSGEAGSKAAAKHVEAAKEMRDNWQQVGDAIKQFVLDPMGMVQTAIGNFVTRAIEDFNRLKAALTSKGGGSNDAGSGGGMSVEGEPPSASEQALGMAPTSASAGVQALGGAGGFSSAGGMASGLGAGGGFIRIAGGVGANTAVYQSASTGNMHSSSDIPAYSGATYDPQTGGISHFATGGHFTVGGGGGTDNRLIAVSPGEHVTVQTPEQYYGGKVNYSNKGRNFRDGGTYAPDAEFHAVKSGVTGYGLINSSNYYFTSAVQAISAAATSLTVAASALSTAATAQTTAANDNNVSKTAAGLGASAGVTTVNTEASASATTSNIATQAQKDAKAHQLRMDWIAYQNARKITGYNGIPVPLSMTGETMAQATNYVFDNGIPTFVGTPTSVQTAGDYDSAYETWKYDNSRPETAFRDGGSFTVPGSGGVDSTLMRLAMSPGEEVTVRTPEQQRQPRARAQGNVTIIQNIQTPDAASFNKSKTQIASDLFSNIRRAS